MQKVKLQAISLNGIQLHRNYITSIEKSMASIQISQRCIEIRSMDGIGDYIFQGDLGKGAFSCVKLAKHAETNFFYAVKIIDKKRIDSPALKKKFESEVRILQQLNHPNIVELYDLLSDNEKIYVVMEFCGGGELFEYILDRGHLTEAEARPLMREILQGLQYVHSFGIAHRDLKPENLLFGDDGEVKISDFGFSRFVDDRGMAQTPCGSPCYASPEVLSGKPYDARKSDIWSAGVVCYAMLTGKLPWTQRNQAALFQQIRQGGYNVPNFLSPLCQDFISKLMEVNDKKRPTAEQALEHPWIGGSGKMNPRRRNSNNISIHEINRFFQENNDNERINSGKGTIKENHPNMPSPMCRCASDPPKENSKKFEIIVPDSKKKYPMTPVKKMQIKKQLPPLPIKNTIKISPPKTNSARSPRKKRF